MSHLDDDQLPPDVRLLYDKVPRAREGLPLLGSVANGDVALDITQDEILLSKPRVISAKALTLSHCIKEYADSFTSTSGRHHAWLLLSKCAAAALSYDARTVPSHG